VSLICELEEEMDFQLGLEAGTGEIMGSMHNRYDTA
jgi:hypothetical protein